VLPATTLLLGVDVGGRLRESAPDLRAAVRTRGPPAPPATTSAADLASLRSARLIARKQLRDAARSLRGCRSPAGDQEWRDCVRWPLAHAAFGGRASSGVLSSVAQDTGPGGCRDRAMGEASGLRLLAGQADELVRGLANTSRLARSERARSFAATRRLIGDLRVQLRRRLPRCEPLPTVR
jgi:hypothetical protein